MAVFGALVVLLVGPILVYTFSGMVAGCCARNASQAALNLLLVVLLVLLSRFCDSQRAAEGRRDGAGAGAAEMV